jgi:nucleoside-diphosphate-sugar epimerase
MNKDTDVIAVAGATGKQGGAVARKLLARGYQVRAMTRTPQSEPARQLSALGADVVQADLDDPASLERVLQEAWVYLPFRTRGRPAWNGRRSRGSASPSSRGAPACGISCTRPTSLTDWAAQVKWT